MDQLKTIAVWLMRHRFWVTCVVVALASLLTWFAAWRAIDARRAEQERKIATSNESIRKVLDTTIETGTEAGKVKAHPNETTQAAMEGLIGQGADAALAAWSIRFAQQEPVLKFAEEIPNEEIRKRLEAHVPMEMPLESELMDKQMRSTFRDFITERMPALAKETIGATWLFDEKGQPSDGAATNGRGAVATVETKPEDLVYWGKANQELWNSKVTEWTGYDGNTDADNVPTSEQMLAIQQDLWILEAMLNVIAKVNEGYVANDLAPIERLDHILVGKDAMAVPIKDLSKVEYKADARVAQAPTTKPTKAPRGSRREQANQVAGPKVAFNDKESTSPFHGRYVDRDFKRLSINEIVQILKSDQLTDRSYLAVAKRVPVRIGVKMDERRINDFLAAAANSPFTFEVRQIRINAHEPNGGVQREETTRGGKGGSTKRPEDLERGGGAGKGGGGGMESTDPGGGSGSGGGKSGDPKEEAFEAELRRNFDVKVEFIGIVKIYNPPDRSLFFPEEEKKDGEPVAPATPTSPEGNRTAASR
jgi:hypothetical protein